MKAKLSIVVALLLLLATVALPSAQASDFTGLVFPRGLRSSHNAVDSPKVVDNNADSAWEADPQGNPVNLDFAFGGAELRTIWIRNGKQSSAADYKATGRYSHIQIELVLEGGERKLKEFSLYDIYDPNLHSPLFRAGYQALDLGEQLREVKELNATFTAGFAGDTSTAFAISDVLFSSKTPLEGYMPKTPSTSQGQDGGGVNLVPEDEENPQDARPKPQPNLAGGGLQVKAIDRIASRSGPSTRYKDTGVFALKGENVLALTRAWDDRNKIWWIQVEVPYKGKLRRVYTGLKRLDLNPEDLPEEQELYSNALTIAQALCFSGPGKDYMPYKDSLPAGVGGKIFAIENGYYLFEYQVDEKTKDRVWLNADRVEIR